MSPANRKAAIHTAAIALLARKGLKGVTHRAIDSEAGLPQGSTSYHYAKKTPLLMATADHLAELLAQDCDDLQVSFADMVAQDGIDAAVKFVGDEVVKYAAEARNLFLARLELTLAATREPDLANLGPKLSEAAKRPIVFYLNLVGQDGRSVDPDKIDSCAGLIDAITMMHVAGQTPQLTTAQIAAVFRTLV